MPVTFGGGATETAVSPMAAVLLCIAIVLILILPRKYVIMPVLLSVFLIPTGNVVVLASVHLQPVRIISLFGCVRLILIKLMSSGKLYGDRWNLVDTIFILWALWRSLAVILLWQTSAALILECGHIWSSIGMYLLLRYFIQDDADIQRVIKLFCIIAVINAAGMVYEQVRSQNLFGIYLGGVAQVPAIRDGSIRSEGVFQHAILAGTFGATLLPLLVWLWKTRASRLLVVLGIVSSAIMVVTSASSTPVGACAGAILAILFWPLRKKMRAIRWGIVMALVALQCVMKAPVWFLIDRVGVIGASTGYFRAMLVDQFIRHFFDWWLIGIKSTASWGESMWDLSNQFVAEGETGGLLTFILFIAIIKGCFARLGLARSHVDGDKKQEWFMWLLGSAMFAHLNAYFGVSYWDQMQYAWFALLAIILAATATRLADATDRVPIERAVDPFSYANGMHALNRGSSL
ncbi:MAG TPA: hypothetical protein VNE63_16245 [Candidatus Acidoferrales bacterium]|nr:hypothetical protein [Candidatus Acidoferrales bacterium]